MNGIKQTQNHDQLSVEIPIKEAMINPTSRSDEKKQKYNLCNGDRILHSYIYGWVYSQLQSGQVLIGFPISAWNPQVDSKIISSQRGHLI